MAQRIPVKTEDEHHRRIQRTPRRAREQGTTTDTDTTFDFDMEH
jgi:hypothetical protein